MPRNSRPESGKQADAASSTRQFDKRLLAYTLAAAGATVLASPANASVVFTKTDTILNNGFLNIDLNQDGTPDFTLHNFSIFSSYPDRVIEVKGNASDAAAGVIVRAANSHWASPLPVNYAIGTGVSQPFRFQSAFIPSGVSYQIQDKFLGLRFTINGELHYGWARFSARGIYFTRRQLRLTGFAYETQPNTTILAGDRGSTNESTANIMPSSAWPHLGLLSLGMAGLEVWRTGKSSVSLDPQTGQ